MRLQVRPAISLGPWDASNGLWHVGGDNLIELIGPTDSGAGTALTGIAASIHAVLYDRAHDTFLVQAAASGASTVFLDSVDGYSANDSCRVELDNQSEDEKFIMSVDSSARSLTFGTTNGGPNLSYAASIGRRLKRSVHLVDLTGFAEYGTALAYGTEWGYRLSVDPSFSTQVFRGMPLRLEVTVDTGSLARVEAIDLVAL